VARGGRGNVGKLVVRCFKGILEGRMKSYIDGRLEEIRSRRGVDRVGNPSRPGGFLKDLYERGGEMCLATSARWTTMPSRKTRADPPCTELEGGPRGPVVRFSELWGGIP
jgi:hypothetical protein